MLNITIEAFMLGISTGVYCFSQCGIVFIPYIFSENKNRIREHLPLVFQFLFGRFIAYAAIGIIVGYIGQTMYSSQFFASNQYLNIIIGSSYLILSSLLIINAFFIKKKESCKFVKFKKYSHYPALLGIFTGINICPPFILAITKAFNARNIAMGTLFFVMFFTATSVFILPFVFSGLLKKTDIIKTIARATSLLAGVYLAIQGAISIYSISIK